MRAIDTDVVCNSTNVFVYAKIARLVIVACLQNSEPEHWVRTRIERTNSSLQSNFVVPGDIGEFLIHKANEFHSLLDTMSKPQMEKLADAMMKDPNKTANSDSFNAMMNDVAHFGMDAFPDSAE